MITTTSSLTSGRVAFMLRDFCISVTITFTENELGDFFFLQGRHDVFHLQKQGNLTFSFIYPRELLQL